VADAPVHDGLDLAAAAAGVEPQPGQAGGEPVKMTGQPEESSVPHVHHA
jgi:hypothetical protein